MGWLWLALLALLVLAALWRFARLDAAALQFVAAGLLLAVAGYAWQGRPGLAGQPVRPLAKEEVPDSEFTRSREAMLGRFDTASRWLIIAEGYHRRGDTENAAGVIRAGLRAHPRDPDLWVGLGNALVVHGDGLMSPAAEHAFRRASALAPDHPGPKFFYGLSLAQGGQLDAAERVWRGLLAGAPAGAAWRAQVEERLASLAQARGETGGP